MSLSIQMNLIVESQRRETWQNARDNSANPESRIHPESRVILIQCEIIILVLINIIKQKLCFSLTFLLFSRAHSKTALQALW